MIKNIEKLSLIYVCLMLLLFFIVDNGDDSSKWTIRVDKNTALEVTISNVYLNHNNLVFNDSIHFNVGLLSNHSSEIIELEQMKTPFFLQKKGGSDTTTLISSQHGIKYLVLK